MVCLFWIYDSSNKSKQAEYNLFIFTFSSDMSSLFFDMGKSGELTF